MLSAGHCICSSSSTLIAQRCFLPPPAADIITSFESLSSAAERPPSRRSHTCPLEFSLAAASAADAAEMDGHHDFVAAGRASPRPMPFPLTPRSIIVRQAAAHARRGFTERLVRCSRRRLPLQRGAIIIVADAAGSGKKAPAWRSGRAGRVPIMMPASFRAQPFPRYAQPAAAIRAALLPFREASLH